MLQAAADCVVCSTYIIVKACNCGHFLGLVELVQSVRYYKHHSGSSALVHSEQQRSQHNHGLSTASAPSILHHRTLHGLIPVSCPTWNPIFALIPPPPPPPLPSHMLAQLPAMNQRIDEVKRNRLHCCRPPKKERLLMCLRRGWISIPTRTMHQRFLLARWCSR